MEWIPKNAKSGAEEQENAMARDAMATIEGDLHAVIALNMVFTVAERFQYSAWEQCAPLQLYWFGLLAGACSACISFMRVGAASLGPLGTHVLECWHMQSSMIACCSWAQSVFAPEMAIVKPRAPHKRADGLFLCRPLDRNITGCELHAVSTTIH